MSAGDNPLSDGDIAASNVLPTFETSLRFGATEHEIAREIGWRRDALSARDAWVSGASTYAHLELMFRKPRYGEMVIAAARAHDASSLGIVGLACKTLPSVGAALVCHGRYQALTNRSARYETVLLADGLLLREHRRDPRLGSLLVSDYASLVAACLLRALSASPVRVLALHSRRASVPDEERALIERELGCVIEIGRPHAALVLDPTVVDLPVAKADAELAGYFRDVLARALPETTDPAEPELLRAVRAELRAGLHARGGTLEHVARVRGIGARTLQRRLAALGTTFEDLLDETRRGLAEGYLKQPRLSLAEIAWLLGYAEQASFFRAFRRWFGATPGELRARNGLPVASPPRSPRGEKDGKQD